ncbi:hypothetical protein AAF712_010897 [Marasmius tenuissimus]|uniref:Uncharacterized protein n=1 Tax=Marasmius tenuissimus TaxID=585030 RepID=A0ABR2ZLM9_9AGAR
MSMFRVGRFFHWVLLSPVSRRLWVNQLEDYGCPPIPPSMGAFEWVVFLFKTEFRCQLTLNNPDVGNGVISYSLDYFVEAMVHLGNNLPAEQLREDNAQVLLVCSNLPSPMACDLFDPIQLAGALQEWFRKRKEMKGLQAIERRREE